MKTYSFEPEKTNAKKYAFLASLFGLIFICTKVGLKSSVFVVFFYIIFMIIAFAENFNIKNSRFELQENKLDHYIKSKLVRSFDLNNDSLAITTFNHGRVLIIRQKNRKFQFHENNMGKENFDKLVVDLTGKLPEKKFTDFTK